MRTVGGRATGPHDTGSGQPGVPLHAHSVCRRTGWWKAWAASWTQPPPALAALVSEPALLPGGAGREVLRSRRGTETGPASPEVTTGTAQLPDATALDGVM
ncbi:hypothetical protein [Streptomyces sp. NBC_00280]|uniref:hypothetical protein n=1 Tax=Streptomyces sp. NBC_00280 TaxID=2975699 RepID=UPI00324701FE